jgi:carbon-monoxide dehydrogenase medium subunit
MTPFELAEPASMREAIGLLAAGDPATRPIAGGTAVMLMMKTGLFRPERLVSLRRIEPRYSSVEATADGGLRIGAMATLARLEHAPEVRRAAPVIARALRRLSNVRVRTVATLGGHLAHADPHMDLPPVLIALGATLVVLGPGGERTLAVEDLFRGYLETALAPGELIAEVVVPPQPARGAAYVKVTTRSADDWPALGLAVALGGDGRASRIAIGAATETARRLAAAEAELSSGDFDEPAIRRTADAAAAEAELESDQRGSAAYKRELVRVHTGRAIRAALDASGGAA